MVANRPNRGSVLAATLKGRIKPLGPSPGDLWEMLNWRIKGNKVVPILANSVRNDLVFSPDISVDGDAGASPSEPLEKANSIDETLSEAWATSLGYPLEDQNDLARVAQYNRVRSEDAEQAKVKYLAFLKTILLEVASNDNKVASLVPELRKQIYETSFADLAQKELGYPRFAEADQDTLRLLARLNLPVYITTSYYDFLEKAIILEKRKPITQVCFWSGPEANLPEEHRPRELVPTPENPVVYHLFGLEQYPKTLVLSEDDYLDYLVEVTGDTDTNNPIIPHYLRAALSESALVLLGYRLRDWDFRVLFRVIIHLISSDSRPRGLILQLKPEQSGVDNPDEARKYLQDYFEPSAFNVEWYTADEFIHKLWEEWNKWRQAQA